MDGLGLVPLVMGLFGISEFPECRTKTQQEVFQTKIKGLLRIRMIGNDRLFRLPGEVSWGFSSADPTGIGAIIDRSFLMVWRKGSPSIPKNSEPESSKE